MKVPNQTESLLRDEIRKRLATLGMSQRELSRRISISRQTLQNVINHPEWSYSDATFAAIDAGLKWQMGTTRALHSGNRPDRFDGSTIEERINEYLRTILQRLREMDIDELEREVLMLEEESNETIRSNDPSRKLIDAQIARLVAALSHQSTGELREDAV